MNYSTLDMSILKSLVSNKKRALDFANENDPSMFTPELWNFAKVVTGYVRTYKDVPTLRVIIEKLAKGSNDKLIESITNIWNELDRFKVNDAEYKHDLDKIKNHRRRHSR